MQLDKHYNPQQWEHSIYTRWEQAGAFKAREASSSKTQAPAYAIILPPPNVTGALHIGHALNHSIQDCLVRWKRMQGFNTLWLPGTDHAGIATQGVVERELATENTLRQQLGRTKFVERVWKWKHQYGDRIYKQMRLLGDSCDWDRQVFTLDKGVSRAVREVFVSLYKKALIYRGQRMVNWSCKLESAISDLEVEHRDTKGHLWHIKYPVVGTQEHLIVATTRPETLFGDTAVAVAPGDERYQHLINKKVKLPLTNRELPVVADEDVSSDFGSGVVKITPAHDFNDYQVGVRHQLDMPCILTLNGKLKDVPAPYQDLSVQEARKLVVQHLEQQNLLHKVEEHRHSVGYCSRSGCVVEPMLSTQWFLKTKSLAGPAKAVVENGSTSFEPELWTKTYLHWLKNIEDWCLSRQLWWGHQIPAWYCDKGHITVAQQAPAKCNTCGSTELKQDDDVLDTWFSSALWPFSTLGWPEKTPALQTFYPTQCLVTGHDIIFFWVARMMMMGLEFCGDIPFRKVYVHGLVRDSKGQKMSKSLGNSVDPVKVIEKHGADTLRLTCLSQLMPGRDLKLGDNKLEVQRNFINKVWNAARFVLNTLESCGELATNSTELEQQPAAVETDQTSDASCAMPDDTLPPITNDLDAWLVQRLNQCIQSVNTALEKYRFDEACAAIYKFAWHEFCDWYLEMIKPLLHQPSDHELPGRQLCSQTTNTKAVLLWAFNNLLRLWHPFCPFVTEHIYAQLLAMMGGAWTHSQPEASQLLMLQKYPVAQHKAEWKEPSERIDLVCAVIRAIRTWRAENKIHFTQKIKVHLVGCSKVLQQHQAYIKDLGGLSTCTITDTIESEQGCSVWPVQLSAPGRQGEPDTKSMLEQQDELAKKGQTDTQRVVRLVIPLEGVVDVPSECARIQRGLTKLAQQQAGLEKRLANTKFVQQAPPDVVADLRTRIESLRNRHNFLAENLKRLQ